MDGTPSRGRWYVLTISKHHLFESVPVEILFELRAISTAIDEEGRIDTHFRIPAGLVELLQANLEKLKSRRVPFVLVEPKQGGAA